LILIGARQVGKTHLMIELEKFTKAKKKKSKKYSLLDNGIRNSIIRNFSLLMKILMES
jgi:predicted AAA+ superfamily ATPase